MSGRLLGFSSTSSRRLARAFGQTSVLLGARCHPGAGRGFLFVRFGHDAVPIDQAARFSLCFFPRPWRVVTIGPTAAVNVPLRSTEFLPKMPATLADNWPPSTALRTSRLGR